MAVESCFELRVESGDPLAQSFGAARWSLKIGN